MVLDYRRDIEGLRAIAVVSVVLFHMRVPIFQGGYAGVDVFFVISGYLITRMLVAELHEFDRIDLYKFYYRRICRLFPALFVTVLFSLLVGFFLFPPDYMASLGTSSASSVISLANIYFWLSSGYFDDSSYMKPLLHTWSLSVEEQFYLFWPLLLGTFFIFKKHLFSILLVIGLFSFFLNFPFSHDANLLFFMLPFRVFEFVIGALIAIFLENFRKGENFLFLIGFLFVASSFVVFDEHTIFPYYNALLPCLGAGLMIVGGRGALGGVLRIGVAVWLGRISYSIYLVHWPLIVFYEYYYLKKSAAEDWLYLAAGTLFLAILLFHGAEKPLRKVGSYTGRKLYLSGCGIAAAIMIMVGYSAREDGWKSRYSDDILALMDEGNLHVAGGNPLHGCLRDQHQGPTDVPESCYLPDPRVSKPTILLAGDSTANQLGLGMLRVLGDRYQIKIFGAAACAPLYRTAMPFGRCAENNDYLFSKLIAENKYDLVIFSMTSEFDRFAKNFHLSLAEISKRNVNYILLGQSIIYKDKPINIIARFGMSSNIQQMMRSNLEISCSGEHGLDRLVPANRFFSVKQALCNGDTPIFQNDGKILQIDTLHLTDYGSIYVSKKLKTWLELNSLLPEPNKTTSSLRM